MKHQVAAAMPKCFENWCRRFDDLFSRGTQRQGFRMYLGGLLGESERKNFTQIASNTVDGSYNNQRQFLNDSPWNETKLNDRRLELMQQCRQTKLRQGFTLIIDDSGHRKSGDATAGVEKFGGGEVGSLRCDKSTAVDVLDRFTQNHWRLIDPHLKVSDNCPFH